MYKRMNINKNKQAKKIENLSVWVLEPLLENSFFLRMNLFSENS